MPQEIPVYVLRGIYVAAAFLVTLLLARTAGPDVFGQYVLAVSTASMVAVLAVAGQDRILLREMAGDLRAGAIDRAFAMLRAVMRDVVPRALIIAGVYAAVMLAGPVPRLMKADPVVMALGALLVLFGALAAVALAAVRGAGLIVRAQFFDGFQTLLLAMAVGIVFLAEGSLTAVEVVGLAAATLALTTLFNFVVLRRWAGRTEGPSAGNLKVKAPHGLVFMTIRVVHMATEWLPMALITYFLSVGEVGAFRAAAQIILLSSTIMLTGELAVMPQFAGDFRDGRSDLVWDRHGRARRIMVILAGPLLLVAILFPDWLITTIFGHPFAVAAAALPILALGQFVSILSGPVGGLVAMAGEERLLLRLGLASLALLVLLGLVLVPALGLAGAAIAASSAQAVRSVVTYVIAKSIVSGQLGAMRLFGDESMAAGQRDDRPSTASIQLVMGGLPYVPRGPSYTAGSLAGAMNRPPLAITLQVPADAWRRNRPAVRVVTPGISSFEPLVKAGWAYARPRLLARFESHFMDLAEKAPPDTLFWLFGELPLALSERLHARGVRVVREKINAGKALARKVYEDERRATGFPIVNDIREEDCAKEAVEMALADAVFCPSPMVEESMRFIGVPEAKLLATSYGWEPARLLGSKRALEPAAGPTFLFVGLVCFHKGAHILIEAWERAGIQGRLVLAGQMEPEFKAVFGKRVERPDIVHLGFVRDIGTVYRCADWLIFPSLAEGGPQVTYEAAGCRVPAIVTPAGAGHMTRDGQEGFVIASLDPDPWADAIRAAAANPEQRERMATRAEARAQLFTWAQVGARRIELLKARFGL